MIAVVDYRAGNGPSVLNALETIQASCKMAKSAADFDGATAIILPGVGSADATIASLKAVSYTHLDVYKRQSQRPPLSRD